MAASSSGSPLLLGCCVMTNIFQWILSTGRWFNRTYADLLAEQMTMCIYLFFPCLRLLHAATWGWLATMEKTSSHISPIGAPKAYRLLPSRWIGHQRKASRRRISRWKIQEEQTAAEEAEWLRMRGVRLYPTSTTTAGGRAIEIVPETTYGMDQALQAELARQIRITGVMFTGR